MDLVQQLEQELEAFKREYEKFAKGNKSAGTRARKVLQDIKRTCQDLRVSIQGVKKDAEPKKAENEGDAS
jgi:phage-related minor tail protein